MQYISMVFQPLNELQGDLDRIFHTDIMDIIMFFQGMDCLRVYSLY